MPGDHPAALANGDILPMLEDIYQVTGGLMFKREPFTIRGNRNMTIIRQDDELTLVNMVRLQDPGLAQLLPSHGKPVIGNAANLYRTRVEELQRERGERTR